MWEISKAGLFLFLTITNAYFMSWYFSQDMSQNEAYRFKRDNKYKILIISGITLYLMYRIAIPSSSSYGLE